MNSDLPNRVLMDQRVSSMTLGQLEYEKKRAAKVGLDLDQWLARKHSDRLTNGEKDKKDNAGGAAEIVARIEMEVWGIGSHTQWFHGGIAGLSVGDKLLPGTQVGNSNSNRGQWGAPRSGLPQVYVTPDPQLAFRYAVHYPAKRGAIYLCQPAYDIEIFEGQRVILDYLIACGFG